MGPNRRSDRTAIELLLEFPPAEIAAVRACPGNLGERLAALLERCGIARAQEALAGPRHENPVLRLGEWFCATALLLQNRAGHRVGFRQVLKGLGDSRFRFIYEREESDTGERAGDLALLLLSSLVPGLEWQPHTIDAAGEFPDLVRDYLAFAEPLAMPLDSLAIVAAARRRDVPVIKLERDPYEPVRSAFRVRPNGLLMLGQARHQQLIDGTICVTRSPGAVPLVFEARRRARFLADLGLSVRPGAAPGYRILLAGGEPLACLALREGSPPGIAPVPTDAIEAGIAEQARDIARRAAVGLLEVSLAAADIRRPLTATGGAFSDFQPAPDLAPYAAIDEDLRRRAAAGFVDWVFPPPHTGRIPSVAITGTNGKSTTTTMIAHVMRHAGHRVGVAHTEGVVIDGQHQELDDLSGLRGHYRVFESRAVDMAVLETARGGVIARGFGFDWCSVGVCLNVSDDHLGLQGVHTLAQMAEVKRSIVARARDGAVLNADDPSCAAMAAGLPANALCMVSMRSTRQALAARFPDARAFCVLERSEDQDWIVWYEDGARHPVLPASEIPATLGGAVHFNTCNAMHAIAASRLAGQDLGTAAAAMRAYRTGPDVLLGRMNFFEHLPFRVLMDYAHNPDGIAQLLRVIPAIPVTGRRLVVLGAAGDRSDAAIMDTARPMAAHFDLFIAKNYPDLRGRAPLEVPRLLRRALIEEGVPERSITLIDDELEAVRCGLESCRAGDFLLLLVGHTVMHEARRAVEGFAADPR